MTGDSDLVEQAVQLADDGGDLLRKVAGVHVGDSLPTTASSVAYAL